MRVHTYEFGQTIEFGCSDFAIKEDLSRLSKSAKGSIRSGSDMNELYTIGCQRLPGKLNEG